MLTLRSRAVVLAQAFDSTWCIERLFWRRVVLSTDMLMACFVVAEAFRRADCSDGAVASDNVTYLAHSTL